MAVPIVQPWEPIGRSGLVLTLSHGRTYNFSTPFGSQFTVAGGAQVLASPIELRLQGSNGGGLQTVSATPSVVHEEDGQVQLGWSWTGTNGLSAAGTTTVEADGLVRQQFTLSRSISQQWQKVQLRIPLFSSLCRYCMRLPRPGGVPEIAHSSAEDLSSGFLRPHAEEGKDGIVWGTSSANFPRIMKIHDGDSAGLEWAQEVDEFWAANTANSNGSIRLNCETGIWELNVCNGNWYNGTGPMTFDWSFTPLPQKPVVRRIPLVGDTLATPAKTTTRIMAEECPGKHYKWMGSGIPREGAWPDSNPTTFEERIASYRSRGLRIGAYMVFGNWPNADPLWQESWRISNGFTQTNYTTNCSGLVEDRYQLRGTHPEAAGFAEHLLSRMDDALTGGLYGYADDIYFDTTHIALWTQGAFIDATGRGRQVFLIRGNRDLSRRIALHASAAGAEYYTHPQCDFAAAAHAFADFTVPGEEQNRFLNAHYDPIVTNADAVIADPESTPEQIADAVAAKDDAQRAQRRYYMDDVPEYWWRAVCAPTVFGCGVLFLPQAPKTGATGFGTQNLLAMISLYGLGFWHSFSSPTVFSDWSDAIREFNADGAQFVGYWRPNCPVVPLDDDCRISCFVYQHKILAAVVNFSEEDRLIEVRCQPRVEDAHWRYSGTSASSAEGRPSGYAVGEPAPVVDESDPDQAEHKHRWLVGVARKNMTLVEFELQGAVGGGGDAVLAASHLHRQRLTT